MKHLSLIGLLLTSQFAYAKIEVQGHRGARGNFPENTLAAFDYALAVGVDVLELDLAVTKDNVLVVSHDPLINTDLCLDASGNKITAKIPIHGLTLSEIKTYDCGTLLNPKFPKQVARPKEKIPTLEEVFEYVKNSKYPSAAKVRFNVETKLFPAKPHLTPTPKDFAKLVVQVVKKHGLEERVTIQSFDHRSLAAVKALQPKIKTTALIYGTYPDLVALARNLHVDIIAPDVEFIDKEAVDKLRKIKVRTVVWTANTEQDWDYLINIGVDGIISDYPGELIEYLKKKGV